MIIIGISTFSQCYPAHPYANLRLVCPLDQTIKAPAWSESQLIGWMMAIPQALLTPFSLLSTVSRMQKWLSEKDGAVLARSP